MASKSEKKWKMDATQEKILASLARLAGPVAATTITSATGLAASTVGAKLRGLVRHGFVSETPSEGFTITEVGRVHAGPAAERLAS